MCTGVPEEDRTGGRGNIGLRVTVVSAANLPKPNEMQSTDGFVQVALVSIRRAYSLRARKAGGAALHEGARQCRRAVRESNAGEQCGRARHPLVGPPLPFLCLLLSFSPLFSLLLLLLPPFPHPLPCSLPVPLSSPSHTASRATGCDTLCCRLNGKVTPSRRKSSTTPLCQNGAR